MFNEPQINRMLSKLKQLAVTMEGYIFRKVDSLDTCYFETSERLNKLPEDKSLFKPSVKGMTWGKELGYCWYDGTYHVKPELDGKALYVMPDFGSYETMVFVNGVPFGEIANKIRAANHGSHYCDMITMHAKANEDIHLSFEAYAGHFTPGSQPFGAPPMTDFTYTYNNVWICTKDMEVSDFVFDLRALNELAAAMEPNSFRRADVINCLTEVHKVVYYSPEHAEEAEWRAALAKAREIMRPCLEAKNAASQAYCGLIGHSHMDTAWHWTIPETIKKCARTYSNQMSLMEQYPEYTFMQSSAYHTELVRRNYPALFERIKEKIAEGRYEPNGAVWVECDCNITGGESMIRQFLWGQKYTQKNFNFTSNCFWLPDTFGYSAAIPQIMKGCKVDYFLTTKISWNDTNRFPYETFYWEGIDGTRVFVHYNTTHNWPSPETMIGRTSGNGQVNEIQQKTVSDTRLISYGFGDGGGGPQFEMIEMARRCRDLDGCPTSRHVLVGDFMKDLEKRVVSPNTYAGELYLELHRGTLTNLHETKYNNRKSEIGLRNMELYTVATAVKDHKPASDEKIHDLFELMLVNQFHDILPGTCIAAAHDQSHAETAKIMHDTAAAIHDMVADKGDLARVTALNPHSFVYDDVVCFDEETAFLADETLKQQHYTDLEGRGHLAVYGLNIPAMSSRTNSLTADYAASGSPFKAEGNVLTTPWATVTFNEKGYMSSFIDRTNNRELVKEHAFNTFWFAEDVPSAWDNWDVDADFELKFHDSAALLSREVVSDGDVEYRIRSEYRISSLTTLRQDMIFYAHTPRVDFETIVDWNDKRRFLKVGFDTTILARTAKHDIQFGYVQKPTTRNNSLEQAMFEVVNHKYTDISENTYGAALLNDCKYGISVKGGDMRLSLHKGGIRPDARGDRGVHKMNYSFVPHNCGFSADCVIKPSYMFNNPAITVKGECELPALLACDKNNVIVEAIKPCEDGAENAFIARVYEAEGSYTNATLTLGEDAGRIARTNMLEEIEEELPAGRTIDLTFKPFEIKTIKIFY